MSTKSFCIYSVVLLFLLFGVSCQNTYRDSSLKETEYYFDDRLSSISATGDSISWLGTENGDLWCIGKQTKDFYHLSYNRIYDVYSEGVNDGVRTCWVGMRNAGVQQWALANGQGQLIATYPMVHKGTSYSAYDIQPVGSLLFIATSQGLMVLDRSLESTNQLQRIFPGEMSDTQRNGAPFVVKKLCLLSPNHLVAATQQGLLHVDISTMRVWMSHENEHIQHIAVYDGLLHILAEEFFYIESSTGSVIEKKHLDFHVQYFYRAADTFCFINMNHAWMTDDLKSFIPMTLRRKVPPESTNLSYFNKQLGFTYLVTENALWRIPVHLDMFSDHAPIVAACANGKDVYYVSSKNEIFLQQENAVGAIKIFDFIHEPSIVNIAVEGSDFYFTNIKNEVKHIHLTDHLLSNFVLVKSRLLYQSEAKITTFGLHQGVDSTYLYLGVQDGLVRMDMQGGRVDTLHLFDDKYVTSFFSIPKSQLLYLTTLNDGVFMSRNHVFKAVETTNNQYTMRHMALTEDFPPRMVTLTSRSIVMQGSMDTIRVKGVNRVFFVNDSILYGLPEYGLMKYVRRENQLVYLDTYYRDIQFNPRGVVIQHGQIYLGSAAGVLCIHPGEELALHWVKMGTSYITRRLLVIILLSVLLGALLVYLMYRRYKCITVNHIRDRKHELTDRLNGLKEVSMLLHGAEGVFDTSDLEEQMEGICLRYRFDLKVVNRQLDVLSEQIMKLTGNSALLLFKHVDKQTEQIMELEIDETQVYLRDTSLVLASGVIDAIRGQALINDRWLKRVEYVQGVIMDYQVHLKDVLILDGVTQGLMATVIKLKEDMTIYPIALIEERLGVISERYQAIFSEDSLDIIKEYCGACRSLLLEKVVDDGVKKAQLSQIDTVMKKLDSEERIAMLRRLRIVNGRIEQLLIRQKLAQVMEVYSSKREGIVRANEELVNKHFDKQLEADIASSTRGVTDEIDGLIKRLYEYMVITDCRLVTEVLAITNYDHQQAKVLALLIANRKVKRTHIPGMLGVFGNLNPVISRLMKNKILSQQEEIRHYKERHPVSLAAYIVSLIGN